MASKSAKSKQQTSYEKSLATLKLSVDSLHEFLQGVINSGENVVGFRKKKKVYFQLYRAARAAGLEPKRLDFSSAKRGVNKTLFEPKEVKENVKSSDNISGIFDEHTKEKKPKGKKEVDNRNINTDLFKPKTPKVPTRKVKAPAKKKEQKVETAKTVLADNS